MGKGIWVAVALLVAASLVVGTARAEWVRGEVRLNLRTGPGSNRKIITTISTGDRVTVMRTRDNWTHVRIEDGRDGWIPAGFLTDEAPAVIRLSRLEKEAAEATRRLDRTSVEAESLRSTNGKLTTQNDVLTEANLRLEAENRRLKANARWPEWITGAAILAVGMLLGAILQSRGSRRAQSRIRL